MGEPAGRSHSAQARSVADASGAWSPAVQERRSGFRAGMVAGSWRPSKSDLPGAARSDQGQHCWHQKVRVEKPAPDDRYGDVFVDTNKSHEVYRRWLEMTRPAPGPDNLRRPLWLIRVYRPAPEAFYLTLRD